MFFYAANSCRIVVLRNVCVAMLRELRYGQLRICWIEIEQVQKRGVVPRIATDLMFKNLYFL